MHFWSFLIGFIAGGMCAAVLMFLFTLWCLGMNDQEWEARTRQRRLHA
jgi:hypothetical protein